MQNNPYYIEPAGKNIGSGLVGIGQILGKKREERMAKEQANIAAEQEGLAKAQKKKLFADLDTAYRAGDMETVQSLTMQNPELAQAVQTTMGFEDSMRDRQMGDSENVLKRVLTSSTPEQARDALIQHIDMLYREGRDATQSVQLLEEVANPETFEEGLITAGEMFAINNPEGFKLFNEAMQSARGKPAEAPLVRSSTTFPDGSILSVLSDDSSSFTLPSGEKVEDPLERGRAITKAIARGISLKGESAAAESAARASAEFITNGMNQITNAKGNISLYDEAIAELDNGADTGVITSMLPAFKTATLNLRNIGSQLGLQVIAGATFGALSKGEMDMAMSTALPTNLEPAALKQWLVRKKEAQKKLINEIENAVMFMNQGKTPGQYIEAQAKLREEMEGIRPLTPEEQAELDQLRAELGDQ